MQPPRFVVLAGGVGGARFVRGLRLLCQQRWPDGSGGTAAEVTVVVNTGDDLWLAGLRVTPDLDSLLYALAGVNDAERGWGRAGESERVSAELTAFGVGWPWFTLGDLDLGTHIARTAMLRDGLPLSAATARIQARWPIGVRLLPATDDEVETHVVVTEDGAERELHFEEWWVRTRAALPGRTAAMQITSSQVSLDFISDERARELCGEFTRWYDLKRTSNASGANELLTRVRDTNYAPALVNRPNGVYGSNAAINIKDYHVLRPIPQQEIDRTSGKITQNVGY